MILEEYGPEVVHAKGENNVIADALSRLNMQSRLGEEALERKATPPLQSIYVTNKYIDIAQLKSIQMAL